MKGHGLSRGQVWETEWFVVVFPGCWVGTSPWEGTWSFSDCGLRLCHTNTSVNHLMLSGSSWEKFQAQSWCWVSMFTCLIIWTNPSCCSFLCIVYLKARRSHVHHRTVVCGQGKFQGFSGPDVAIFFQCLRLVGLQKLSLRMCVCAPKYSFLEFLTSVLNYTYVQKVNS